MASNLIEYRAQAASIRHRSELSDADQRGEILFRKFLPDGDDEQQMRNLLFNNAFLGQPFDAICPCERWFADVVLSPYIKHQPENTHVAIHQPSGRLIGYLTGSMGREQFEKAQYDWVRKQVVSLAVSLSMPWSFFEQASRRFATHVIFKGESERPNHPESGVHWHYQVDREFRGQGVGATLLRRFVDEALEAGFGLIWAEVMAYPAKPPEYFEERGWSIYDARPTRIFGDRVDFPVQVLTITRPLDSFETLKLAA